MKRFEIGKTYYDTWACDSDSISTIKIVARSEKMVTFERNGKNGRAKIYTGSIGEYIIPDHYSMACVYRAERELLPEEPENTMEPITEYYVSPDVLAFGFIGSFTGRLTQKQNDFLMAIVDNAKGVI